MDRRSLIIKEIKIMPELPEVETVLSALKTVMLGQIIKTAFVGRKDLRWPLPKNLAYRIEGRFVEGLERRGKYILIRLEGEEFLLIHLGMSGSIRIHESQPSPQKHDHFMMTISSSRSDYGSRFVVLHDPRRFGWIDLFSEAELPTHSLLSRLGPEPLDFSSLSNHFQHIFRGRTGTIKNILMDQKIIAGIGNIYANESLFHAKISPRRKTANLIGSRAERLAFSVVKVLNNAIEDGGTSLRDHVQPNGELGYFSQRLSVYGRTGLPCVSCQTMIKSLTQSGRSSFYCPSCQR